MIHEHRLIILPLKNLGLGPALTISVFLKVGGDVVTGRVAPGLAPMEQEEWPLLTVPWEADELPSLEELVITGECTDAAGRAWPLHFMGYEVDRLSDEDVEDIPAEALDPHMIEESIVAGRVYVARYALRQALHYTVRFPNEEKRLEAWANFWRLRPDDPEDDRAFDEIAREMWAEIGGPQTGFLTKDGVAQAQRRFYQDIG